MTIGDTTYTLPDPFMVMATQNPIDQEVTYQLPEVQLDRLLLKVRVDYPTRDEEQNPNYQVICMLFTFSKLLHAFLNHPAIPNRTKRPLLLEPVEQLGVHSARGGDGVLGGGIHHRIGDGGPTS